MELKRRAIARAVQSHDGGSCCAPKVDLQFGVFEWAMRAKLVPVGPGERIELQSWLGRPSMPAAVVDRARVVLWLAEGRSVTEVAGLMGWSRPTVHCWRDRFIEQGPVGLMDLPRSGRPKTVDRQHIVATTLTPPPKKYGVTHWSSRLLGKHLDISYGVISKVWRENGIQPWRAEKFKFSTDPELVAKVTDVVGLYLNRTTPSCCAWMSWVGLGRVDVFTNVTFPQPALRTGRARLHASGSPRVHAVGLCG
jgi:transposase